MKQFNYSTSKIALRFKKYLIKREKEKDKEAKAKVKNLLSKVFKEEKPIVKKFKYMQFSKITPQGGC